MRRRVVITIGRGMRTELRVGKRERLRKMWLAAPGERAPTAAGGFEYPTAAAAESAAAKISPDGSGVTTNGCAALITWVGPPHFYRHDQLIVVYAGSADAVLRPLEAVLGKPFASR